MIYSYIYFVDKPYISILEMFSHLIYFKFSK